MVKKSGIPEMNKAIGTFKHWQVEILNSFIYGYLNGFLEGINHLTKVIKRNAYGYRNIERFRAKKLLKRARKQVSHSAVRWDINDLIISKIEYLFITQNVVKTKGHGDFKSPPSLNIIFCIGMTLYILTNTI